MSTFVALAAILAVLAVVWLARPLWQDRGSRGIAAVVAAVVITGAGLLYMQWSTYDWAPTDTSAAHANEQMVGRLARRLERNPEDVEGWLMLGRSHVALGQYALAQRAYRRVDRLEDGRNAEALLGMAETMVLEADGAMDDRSSRLFEQALELAPNNERALFFAAIAARRRGETPLAITRLERMLELGPPDNIKEILQRELVVMRAEPGPAEASQSAVVAAGANAPSGANAVTASISTMPVTTATPTAGDGTARVRVALQLEPTLGARVSQTDTLFVFVRKPNQPGPPLAVKRLTAGVLPATIELTPADSMVPGLSFSVGDEVEVSAKISADGSATPKTGEPIGRTAYRVGESGIQTILINQLTP
jgi:cytochrome c-type biogenesis protein CcmH